MYRVSDVTGLEAVTNELLAVLACAQWPSSEGKKAHPTGMRLLFWSSVTGANLREMYLL
jgi:hypothetical protein